jgi:hypothetical protein
MSQQELENFDKILNRWQQVHYLMNAREASHKAAALFPSTTLHNDKADAFRHAYWSIMNVGDLGTSLAELMGNAHEDVLGQPWIEQQMDLFNNQTGRDNYQTFVNSTVTSNPLTMSQVAQNLVNNGSFKIISNSGTLIPSNQPQ